LGHPVFVVLIKFTPPGKVVGASPPGPHREANVVKRPNCVMSDGIEPMRVMKPHGAANFRGGGANFVTLAKIYKKLIRRY